MGRHVLAAVVVLVDVALLVAQHQGALPLWAVLLYAGAAALTAALRTRSAAAAFAGAAALALIVGSAYILLLWASYQAGRAVASRLGGSVVVGAGLGSLAVQLTTRSPDPDSILGHVAAYTVFAALPLLFGRYLSQHQRLVTALGERNRQLRARQNLLAEQERLRERLRIARDMHDSLGRRLSLVSVQAAALEVSPLPPPQRDAVRQLATAVRGAADELHELVGTLRATREPHDASHRTDKIPALAEEFQTAGASVTLRRHGQPQTLSTESDQAAYRVVEEGLTNAAKHAPGKPVTVSLEWEPDALLITVVNPLPERQSNTDKMEAGHGLPGLAERTRLAGGMLDHRRSEGRFRLCAMLPAPPAAAPDAANVGVNPISVERVRTTAVGVATAALMFGILPAGMLLGVG